MAIGIGFGMWKTRGFRSNLVDFEVPADDDIAAPVESQT
jgi:hypothetical protein